VEQENGMKVGMNLLLWTAGVTEEHYPLLTRMKQLGFDGVELPLFDADEAGLRRLGDELDRLGLGRTAVTVCTAETNPISPDPAVRRAALDYLRQRIDWTALVGAEILCGPLHSALGVRTGRGRTSEEWAWCVEVLREAATHARERGVLLSIEPLNRFEVYFLNTAADANRLVAEIDSPSLGYLYDTFHANIEEQDIYRSLAANISGVNHIHISENDRGVPGSGHVHWAETFRAIRDTGYDGWLTIEAFGRALPELAAATCVWRDLFDEEDRVAREGAAFVRRSIAQAELA
jgi:D-psicose/D-tagatose/L-ribulose 3-epimerase